MFPSNDIIGRILRYFIAFIEKLNNKGLGEFPGITWGISAIKFMRCLTRD